MKMKVNILLLAVVTLALSGCTSAFYGASSASDDLYAMHNRTEIARRQQAEAEARKAEAEARKAELEARIAEAAARSAEQQYEAPGYVEENYQSVLADSYESAYARRLRGMDSPTYRMPSSYMNARYSTTFHYVSAYDPAFYNVMVMGDEVWVEPKYVTAMFGTWGLPTYSSAWYWNRWTSPWWSPSFSIGLGGWGWNVGLSWYDPWFYDWYSPWYSSWYGVHYGWYRPHWHSHYRHGHGPYWNGGGGYHPGHRPGHGRPGVVHRPSQNRYTRPYQGSTINRGQSGNRNWSSGVYQGGSRPQNSRPQGSGTVSRTPGSSQTKPGYNGSGTTRRSSSSGSAYRSNSNNSWSNSSSSNSNWGSSNSSSRGSGYSGGGGYSGGSSGGSRSGSSGSSSRGR